MKPAYLQLRRTKGWRMPPNTVKVDRSSRWENPSLSENPAFPIAQPLRSSSEKPCSAGKLEFSVADVHRELRGRSLACWCPLGSPCHADVLLELANAATPAAKGSRS
jgi:hypothetical protein